MAWILYDLEKFKDVKIMSKDARQGSILGVVRLLSFKGMGLGSSVGQFQ